MADQVRRFADLGVNFDDVDEWVKMDGLIGQEIIVLDAIESKGTFGPYALFKFKGEDGKKIQATTCGGVVVMEKLRAAKNRNLFPLPGIVTMQKDWYDLR